MTDLQTIPPTVLAPEADRGPDEVRYLDPADVVLTRSPHGIVRLDLADEVCYRRVHVRVVQPLTTTERYVSLWAGDDHEIGIVRDPETLDPDSRQIVDEEIKRRYFAPVIERIDKVIERFGVHEWFARTSRGPVNFYVTGLHQNIKPHPPARLLVTDVRGNRYDIPDYRRLDPHSYHQIQRLL